MEQRTLGRTGRQLSIIGLGGVVFVDMAQTEADRLVSEAIDRGVTYFDVAPSYGHEQETEIRLGAALEPYRDQVFLACKTEGRTAEEASKELHRSLQHLRTDHVDLYQLHHITTVEEVETCFAPGGAMETIVKAQQDGLVRHIGFSAHSVEAALLAMDKFDFDSALFPINFVTYYEGSFGPQIIARAEAKGVARLALKAMARTNWKQQGPHAFPHCWYEPISDPYFAGLALRWTLSQPVTAAVPPGDPRLFRLALDLAADVRPLDLAEQEELRAYGRGLQPIFAATA